MNQERMAYIVDGKNGRYLIDDKGVILHKAGREEYTDFSRACLRYVEEQGLTLPKEERFSLEYPDIWRGWRKIQTPSYLVAPSEDEPTQPENNAYVIYVHEHLPETNVFLCYDSVLGQSVGVYGIYAMVKGEQVEDEIYETEEKGRDALISYLHTQQIRVFI